jgi:LysR family cys regulon transcriptional activator
MELRQLRSLVALVESDFNVSRAALRLHLVQPAVSQHLKQLEQELGTHLVQRRGKRLLGLTEAGERVLGHARAALANTASILAVGRDYRGDTSGVLRIGTTHTQARYVLPPAIRQFRADYPQVEVEIYQDSPRQLVDLLLHDAVDLAICTEALGDHPELNAAPCYRWNRCLIAPLDHPVLARRPLTLELLCEHPLVTYVFGFTGRGQFSNAFAREGLRPRVVLSAADTDVIKTYVREGMGLGVVAGLAFEQKQDHDLGMRSLAHLFPWEVTRIAWARDKFLRAFQRDFVDLFQQQAGRLVGERLVR